MGVKGEKGNNNAVNWKQCVWKKMDGKNTGLIHVDHSVSINLFQKLHNTIQECPFMKKQRNVVESQLRRKCRILSWLSAVDVGTLHLMAVNVHLQWPLTVSLPFWSENNTSTHFVLDILRILWKSSCWKVSVAVVGTVRGLRAVGRYRRVFWPASWSRNIRHLNSRSGRDSQKCWHLTVLFIFLLLHA